MKLLEFIAIPLCENPVKWVFFITLSPGEEEELSKITQVLHNWTRNFAQIAWFQGFSPTFPNPYFAQRPENGLVAFPNEPDCVHW